MVGTMVLVLMGCGSAVFAGSVAGTVGAGVGTLGVALAFGLAVVAMAYTIGGISGCHINPAITLGVYLSGRMSGKDAGMYMIFQVIGAVIGWSFSHLFLPGHMMALLPQAPTLSRRAWGSRRSSPRRFSHSFLCWLSSELRIPEREPGTSPGLPSGSPSSLSISYVSLSQGLLSIRPGVLVLLSLTEGWLSGSSGCSLWLRLSVRFSVQESGNSFLLKKGNSGAVL